MAITVNSVAMIHVHSRWLNHVESTSQPHQQNLIGRIHSKTAQYFLSNQAEPRKASLVLPCWSTHRLHSETWDPQKGCMSSIPNSYKVSFKYIAIFTYIYIYISYVCVNISLDAITFVQNCFFDWWWWWWWWWWWCSALKLGGFPSHLVTILLEATWTMTIA